MGTLGYRHTEEAKRRISENNARYWLGTKGACYGQTMRPETKRKISKALMGRTFTKEWKEKLRKAATGKQPSDESRRKFVERLKVRMSSEEEKAKLRVRWAGKGNPRWAGGITPEEVKLRRTQKYRNWKVAVLQRDNYTCVLCHEKKVKLHVDHIKPFILYPKLRTRMSNGRTLCDLCHYAHGWRPKKRGNRSQGRKPR